MENRVDAKFLRILSHYPIMRTYAPRIKRISLVIDINRCSDLTWSFLACLEFTIFYNRPVTSMVVERFNRILFFDGGSKFG